MPTFEIELPDKIDTDIQSLVDQGEYLNRDQAVEDLLSRGLSAYQTTTTSTDAEFEDTFSEFNDQKDPAMHNQDQNDDYQF